jgi:uridine phosphorylase
MDMKTTVLQLAEEDVTEVVMVVFGEDNTKIQETLKSVDQEPFLTRHTREFNTYRVAGDSNEFTLIVAGLGSASVEIVLAELSFLNVDKVVLAGSCGASSNYKLGEPLLLTGARMINFGSAGYYLKEKPQLSMPSFFLIDIAKKLDLQEAQIVSCDAFYGFGCLLNNEGEPVYAGPGFDNQQPPGYLEFKEMYESKRPYLVDMETAFFYALCRCFGLDGIAIKSPSNHIPFNPKRFISQEEEAVRSSITKTIKLISLLTVDS